MEIIAFFEVTQRQVNKDWVSFQKIKHLKIEVVKTALYNKCSSQFMLLNEKKIPFIFDTRKIDFESQVDNLSLCQFTK